VNRSPGWDEHLAEVDRWIAAAPSSAPGPGPGVPDTVVGDVEDPSSAPTEG
jgi:hypothetical protein